MLGSIPQGNFPWVRRALNQGPWWTIFSNIFQTIEECEQIEHNEPACDESGPSFNPGECFAKVNTCVFGAIGSLLSCSMPWTYCFNKFYIYLHFFLNSSKRLVRVKISLTRLKNLGYDRDKIWKFCRKICRNVQSMNLNVSEHLYLVYLSTCTRRAYISLTLFLQMRTSDKSSWFGHHRY